MKPHLVYGRAYVRVGSTNQKLDRERYEYLLQQRFHGYGFDHMIQLQNFNVGLTFIVESIGKSSLKTDIHWIERWEFPVSVIREAMVNTIVHRDYRQNIKNTVEIRPSKISFYNPAQLFGPTITIERLKRLHPSRPGNKLIAKIFLSYGVV